MSSVIYIVISYLFWFILTIFFQNNLILNILTVLIYNLFSFAISFLLCKKGKRKIRNYIFVLYIVKVIIDCLILIFTPDLIILDLTTVYLKSKIFGYFMFGNIIISLGIVIGVKKNKIKLDFSLSRRLLFYLLLFCFAILNYNLNNYCGIVGNFCIRNIISFTNILLIIPITEVLYSLLSEKHEFLKIIILIILNIVYSIFLIFLEYKLNIYYNICTCSVATNCKLESDNIYDCNFVGTDNKTNCRKKCEFYR